MARETKYKIVQASVPTLIYNALMEMASEAEKTLDELIEAVLVAIIEDDQAAHREAE